jgi:predicted nucleic acid-binding protein
MKGKIFLDSNILVYSSLQDNKEKHDIVLNLWRQLEGNFIFVSTQVVNEVYVSLLKHALIDKDIQNIVLKIIDVCNVSVITINSIKSAWKLKKQYNLSYWDSLIVASAMENNCDILYSEDMQDRQTLEDKLKIINPFKLKKR